MPRSRKFLSAIFLTFLIAYLAFLPTGPYALQLGDMRVEYLLSYLVCAASLPLLRSSLPQMRGDYARIQLCSFGYLAIIALSTALSSDSEISRNAFGKTAGYAYLMLVVPPLICRQLRLIRKSLLLLAAATGGLLLYLEIALGYGVAQRFALADAAQADPGEHSYVDPNMTAIGMLMCVVIALPLLCEVERRGAWLSKMVYRILVGVTFGAALMFTSRTAALSLLVAVCFGLAGARGRGIRFGTIVRRAVPTLVILVAVVFWRQNDVERVIERSSNIIQSEQGNHARLELIQDAWDTWRSSVKTTVIGDGYYSTNPHNEFLRALADDGVLGVVGLLALLVRIYVVCCRGPALNIVQRFSQNALFAFIVCAMLTYGHTKTMWLALMFLMAGYLEAKVHGTESDEWQGAKTRPCASLFTVASLESLTGN